MLFVADVECSTKSPSAATREESVEIPASPTSAGVRGAGGPAAGAWWTFTVRTGAGQPILTTAMEFAPDLIEAMDLYRAGKNQRSLGHFVEGLRAALRLLGSTGAGSDAG